MGNLLICQLLLKLILFGGLLGGFFEGFLGGFAGFCARGLAGARSLGLPCDATFGWAARGFWLVG